MSGGMRGLLRLASATVMLATGILPAVAVQPIPLASGTYCGAGAAKVIVDAAQYQVTIDAMVCRFPVIAADRLQSDLCATPQGQIGPQNLDFRVVGRDFVHAGLWYKRCGDLPASGG